MWAFLPASGSLPSWVHWALSAVWLLGLCWLAFEGFKLRSGLQSMKAEERFQTTTRNSQNSADGSKNHNALVEGHSGD